MKLAFEDNIDDRQVFYDYLKGAEINRKAWYEKIWDHFCRWKVARPLSCPNNNFYKSHYANKKYSAN